MVILDDVVMGLIDYIKNIMSRRRETTYHVPQHTRRLDVMYVIKCATTKKI